MRDLYHDLVPVIALQFAVMKVATDGQVVIDLAGFEGAEIIISSGVITDGDNYIFELKHGSESDGSDLAAVEDDYLIGSEPVFAATDGNKVKSFGYIGPKRYIRVDLKSLTGSPVTGGLFGALVVKGHPRHKPAVS